MSAVVDQLKGGYWTNLQNVGARSYVCGYCGDKVAAKEGYSAKKPTAGVELTVATIHVCPGCKGPTFFSALGDQHPSPRLGRAVPHVPEQVRKLYDEARASVSAHAYTGAVLLCRKLLMHIAVAEGAEEGLSFVRYVEYLADKGYVPPHGIVWVDYIRKRGNEANHEITIMIYEDAKALVSFVEMLLRFIYEFPNLVPADD